MSTVLPEWCQQNMTRNYPFIDSAGDVGIPTSLLVDARFIVPVEFIALQAGQLYISRIQSSMGRLQIFIGLRHSDGVCIPDLWVTAAVIPLGRVWQGASSHIQSAIIPNIMSQYLGAEQWYRYLQGTLIIADTADPRLSAGIVVQDAESGNAVIHSYCIQQPAGISSIIVNGIKLTGDVVIQLGQGLQATVQGSTVTLSSTQSVQDLSAAIREAFGSPIYTINGISPDAEGNITLLGADCTQVTSYGPGSIVISNPCSMPCCTDQNYSAMDAKLQTVRNAIKVLDNYYVSLSSAINSMTSRLSLLISSQE